MYPLLLIFLAMFLSAGCKEENITQIVGPQDWQPPVVTWLSPPDADVRGTVGLDVSVQDSSQVTEVRLYLDGREQDTVFASPHRFEVVTDSLLDGVHLCEARAWDEFGNLGVSPILRVNVANSIAQGPRLLWVPDSFQTIQAAINAATDYDTIRVREGTYHEMLGFFSKGVWLESQTGPLACIIDALGSGCVVFVPPCAVSSTVRGFTLTGANSVVGLDDGAQLNLLNNVVQSDTAWTLLISGSSSSGRIENNLFWGSDAAIQIGYHQGTLFNNIIMGARNYGLWNAAVYRNPLEYGYNLFWLNGENYAYFEPGPGDVYGNPYLDLQNGRLLPDSPGIDSGHPSILDKDSSRSDIGPFGGPYAY